MTDVPAEYLAYMHDLISAYHQKLSEILSPIVAETFRDKASDSIVEKLGVTAYYKSDLKDILLKWGIRSEITDVGDNVLCRLSCPNAASIHPLLSAEHPVCPLGFMALGLIRLHDHNSRIVENAIGQDGSRLTIRRVK